MTKAAALRKILTTLDWNEDLGAPENGPVTAQTIADFDTEYDWGTGTYGEAVIVHLEAAGVDIAGLGPADQGRVAGLVEAMYWEQVAA